jgi:hypothetical protein
MNQQLQNSDKNRHAVLSSAIVAKAVVRLDAEALRGRINIIVVFQKSTRHEFYWVFQARSARSARKSWRYAGVYGHDFNMGVKPYSDFGSFTAYFATIKHAEVRTVRVLHVKRLATMLAKTEYESIHSDWTPQIDITDPRLVRNQNRRLANHIKGRVIDWQG